MPHTTYGLLKAIRTHTISSPDVRVSNQTGRPNACNLCHLDKTLKWSADYLSDWYGIGRPELSEDQQTLSAALLWLLRGDACQRALAAWSFGWEPAQSVSGTEWMPPFLAILLEDPYDAVRYISGRSLRSLSDFEDLQYDFTGAPDDRAELAELITNAWVEGFTQDVNSDGSLMIDNEGGLQRDVLDRITSMRDDRPVLLSE